MLYFLFALIGFCLGELTVLTVFEIYRHWYASNYTKAEQKKSHNFFQARLKNDKDIIDALYYIMDALYALDRSIKDLNKQP